jgi:hypothetical protein
MTDTHTILAQPRRRNRHMASSISAGAQRREP